MVSQKSQSNKQSEEKTRKHIKTSRKIVAVQNLSYEKILNLLEAKSQSFENFLNLLKLLHSKWSTELKNCRVTHEMMFELQKYTATTFNIKQNKKEKRTKRM